MKIHSNSALNKIRISNEKRARNLDLQPDHIRDLKLSISHSKLKHRGSNERFAMRVSNDLGHLEYTRELHENDDPQIPEIDPHLSILIGYMIRTRTPYRITLNNLPLHILICGCSGSGKSTLINLILRDLVGKVGITFFDHKDEGLRFANKYRNSLYAPIHRQRWNCLLSRGDQGTYIRFLAGLISRVMALVPVTANALRAKLANLCTNPNDLPSIFDISLVLQELAKRENRSVLHTAARSLNDLVSSLGKWANVRSGPWPFSEQGMCIIPLKGIPAAIENFYITIFYTQLMDSISQSGHEAELSRVLVFDEARQFFGLEFAEGTGSGRANIQTQAMTQARSYGIANILGTQSASMLQSAVVDNSGTFIALRTNSEKEAKFCCRRLGFPDEYYTHLLNLPVGQAWITSPTFRKPVLVKIPYYELGEFPSTEEIENRMAPVWESWDSQATLSPVRVEQSSHLDFRDILGERETTPSPEDVTKEVSVETTPVSPKEPVSEKILDEYFEFLRSCKSHPEFGSSEHYKGLGWSAGRGNRIKNTLLECGWVTSSRSSSTSTSGGRPRKTLLISEQGERILNEHA